MQKYVIEDNNTSEFWFTFLKHDKRNFYVMLCYDLNFIKKQLFLCIIF